ncbi:MAG: 16S rRNA (uracil(1498)-N(3))-methyltransferase [Leptospirales bacterium]|nr:16S rRNA (uracil(1498)-N(3))-methyltransferase [Leptospirales bacterium]
MFLIFRNQPQAFETWTAEERQHVRARRLSAGQPIYCGDGKQRRYQGVVAENGAQIDLQSFEERIETRRVLLCAVPEGQRRDWLLQKCTELGLTDLVPIEFEHSERSDFGKRADRIIQEAAAQSRRFALPIIHPAQRLDLAIAWAQQQGLAPLVLDPGARESLKPDSDATSYCFVVGPEGGISKAEIEMLRDLPTYHLGQNILRIETAAIAALAVSLK